MSATSIREARARRKRRIRGRIEIQRFLERKWERELDYRLRKALWAFADRRIAVRFQYEWHDRSGRWFRSYGNELWEFADNGLMRRREASINDVEIRPDERRFESASWLTDEIPLR